MCSCMDRGGGGDVGNVVRVWCVKNLRGDAQPSPYRVLFVAREEAKYEAASAPVRFPPVSGLLVSGDEKPF